MGIDKKKKVIYVIKYLISALFILGILFGLIYFVYVFNNNYRDYEFKFTNNAVSIPLGQNGEVPIVSVDDEKVNVTDYTYTSTDISIATVDDNGKITGHKVGATVIVVKAKKSNQKKLLNVNVVLKGNGIPIQDIKLDITELNLKVGDVHNVVYEIIPNGAMTDNVLWSSTNNSVATVDKGLIIGKNVGNCVISVKDGNINKEIKVNVTN
ncbi:MAG: Ig-like domain-containing protein [Bacilli bacterium]|nr:Ig-like domain-containing protein [Bacilli bacterium]